MKAGRRGLRGPRCRLCSAPAADRMRMLDFEETEQPLCLSCVRPYDQGAKAATATLTRSLDLLTQEYARASQEAHDRLQTLRQMLDDMETLRAELSHLRAENERLLSGKDAS